MKVRNINGTSDKTCKCGSWLNHWKKYSSKKLPLFCSAAGCFEKSTVGAHVLKDNSNDKGWYIIPLCNSHNALQGESLTVISTITFVSANVSQTCGE